MYACNAELCNPSNEHKLHTLRKVQVGKMSILAQAGPQNRCYF